MSYERNERIRRAAILVASFDDALAEQLLDSLPPLEATRILAEVERLEEIDPEEQRDVLEEFRRADAERRRLARSAVEFTYSVPLMRRARSNQQAVHTPEATAAMSTMTSAAVDADVPLVIEVLSRRTAADDRGGAVAAGSRSAAAVFAALPADLQAEVLDRIANLQVADERGRAGCRIATAAADRTAA